MCAYLCFAATLDFVSCWLLPLSVRARGRAAGSTVDAMSDAIEHADVMLYGVSLAYKESANCRLEASWDMYV